MTLRRPVLLTLSPSTSEVVAAPSPNPPPSLGRRLPTPPAPAPGAARKPSGDTRRGEDADVPGLDKPAAAALEDELPVGVVLALLITSGRTTPAAAAAAEPAATSEVVADAVEEDDNRFALVADLLVLALAEVPDAVFGVGDLAAETAPAADVEVGVVEVAVVGRRFLAVVADLAIAVEGDFASAAAAIAAAAAEPAEAAPVEPGTNPFLRLLAAAAKDEVDVDAAGDGEPVP